MRPQSIAPTARLLGLGGVVGVVAAAVGGAGCGANVPAHPTWKDDVRPLVYARCVRCHQEDTVGDPLVKAPYTHGIGGFDLDFQDASDIPPDTLALLQDDVLNSNFMSIFDLEPSRRMPPAPAAALEDWEKQVFARWLKDPRP